jgi:hypothetical protein
MLFTLRRIRWIMAASLTPTLSLLGRGATNVALARDLSNA